MRIHREGYKTIFIIAVAFALINLASFYYISFPYPWLSWLIFIISFLFLLFIISFFRVPDRKLTSQENLVICPADGKVVVIEETVDEEYFKDKRLQVSIFMSPLNVHVNRAPIDGEVKYFKYHPGNYLVAWHPKSSTKNERTTVVVESESGPLVLFRQIAGAMARRIVWYVNEGDEVTQGEEFGFIKFGSRVDIFVPVDTEVKVEIGEKVKGGQTIIAQLKV